MSGFSAIRKLAAEVADNGLLAPDLAAAIARVRRAKRHGVRAGNWLTLEQAERLLDTPGSKTNKGKRDRTLLALLVACGLRRQELIKATTFGGALSWKFGLAVRHPKQWTIASETVPAAAVGGVSPRHNCSKTIRFSLAKVRT